MMADLLRQSTAAHERQFSEAGLVVLQERHNRLQKLAITDDLTGLYNGRYFRHFLSRIMDISRQRQSR